MMRKCVLVAFATVAVRGLAEERVDLAAVHRIKAEAFQNGQVMDHLFHLTDVHGPRLTASPGFEAAAAWAVARLREWGVEARTEPWGSFGRSWALERYAARMLSPTRATLPGVPRAWSSGTNGPVTAGVVLAPVFMTWEDEDRRDPSKVAARIARYADAQRGKLRGKIVMIEPRRELAMPTEAAARRFDDGELVKLAAAPDPFPTPKLEWPIQSLPEDLRERERLIERLPLEISEALWQAQTAAWDPLWRFLREEGVVALFTSDKRGAGGIAFAEEAGLWRAGSPVPPPLVVLEPEPYARLARLLERRIAVEVELDVAVDFPEADRTASNVVAEIPGGRRRQEIVMLGAHLDSWHAGTGATDNAAGCAVALEAMRVLKSLGVTLDRTVRLALWSGEEQGLHGSRAYVKEHFGDPVTMALAADHARLAGYFNVDNGTGRIRGVYLQGNDMVRPIFEAWLGPFRDLGATTLSIRDTDGTDHLSFDAVGLPGFQFIQDPVDYSTRTHHSDLDVYDHIQPADMMQASAILAAFVYHAANRPEMLPRKPLPKPLPPRVDRNLPGR
ncbi:MAG TPA: M20/M25/M40 family metallo-hydrolase [Vicinamibacteria bacterium]|nr:M20/M25/M40 family metallo-hydrolase [Vicinamibacteria bacterium]